MYNRDPRSDYGDTAATETAILLASNGIKLNIVYNVNWYTASYISHLKSRLWEGGHVVYVRLETPDYIGRYEQNAIARTGKPVLVVSTN